VAASYQKHREFYNFNFTQKTRQSTKKCIFTQKSTASNGLFCNTCNMLHWVYWYSFNH